MTLVKAQLQTRWKSLWRRRWAVADKSCGPQLQEPATRRVFALSKHHCLTSSQPLLAPHGMLHLLSFMTSSRCGVASEGLLILGVLMFVGQVLEPTLCTTHQWKPINKRPNFLPKSNSTPGRIRKGPQSRSHQVRNREAGKLGTALMIFEREMLGLMSGAQGPYKCSLLHFPQVLRKGTSMQSYILAAFPPLYPFASVRNRAPCIRMLHGQKECVSIQHVIECVAPP